jgi:hypothetical protein
MLDADVEKVLSDIERLSSEQQKEVLEQLEKKVNGKHPPVAPATPKAVDVTTQNFTPRIVGEGSPPNDRSKEYEWLEQHRQEYAYQWVALDGHALISSNTDCRLVIDNARQQGVPEALIVFVEPPDAKSLIMW